MDAPYISRGSSGVSDVDRIKLAEAMGWKQMVSTPGNWYPPGLPPQANALGHTLPDPFTDANDCEALIKWLTEQGYTVVIQIWDTEALVDLETIDNRPNLKGNCDDYKQGVCELALKVLP